MAVNIDTVYQRVLALANKEQRGYITPQEFNLFANLAQFDIFEQYFYDLHQFKRINDNDVNYTNMQKLLEEKIQFFENGDGQTVVAGYTGAPNPNKILPSYIYRIHRIELNNIECELLKTKDFNQARYTSRLYGPTDNRPVANIRNNILRVVGSGNVFKTATGVFYTRKPNRVNWGYVVINEKALYDPSISTNFELHPSEEINLVYKILKYAGISIKSPDVTQAGDAMEMSQIQQEKQ